MTVVLCVVDGVEVKVSIANGSDQTYFHDVKVTLKAKWPQAFIGIGAPGMVVRNPISQAAISSGLKLNEILAEVNGAPLLVDSPPAGNTIISITYLSISVVIKLCQCMLIPVSTSSMFAVSCAQATHL